MSDQKINEAVQQLIATNDLEERELTVPQFQAEDIFGQYSNLFTADAIKALNNKTMNLVHQRIEVLPEGGIHNILSKLGIESATSGVQYRRVMDLVRYLGVKTSTDELDKAAAKIANCINDLASKGYITATLTPLMSLKLNDDVVIVLSYFAVDYQYEDYFNKNYKSLTFEEGNMPNSLENT